MIKNFITCRVGSEDFKLFSSIIDQGIDSHLEGFTESKFVIEDGRLKMSMSKNDIKILVRRLRELDDENADQWADDIEGLEKSE